MSSTEKRVLAATKPKLYKKRRVSGALTPVVTQAGTAAGRGTKAAGQRGTGHKALCFLFWFLCGLHAGVVHAAAAAAVSAAVTVVAAPASASGAAAGFDGGYWGGEFRGSYLRVNLVFCFLWI